MDFEQKLSKAAAWMLKREDKSGLHYWRWNVLTESNVDPDAFLFTPRDAYLIFAALVERGLLIPMSGAGAYEAFAINHDKDSEWDEIIHPRFHLSKQFALKAGDWIVSGIIGFLMGAAISHVFCPK